MTVTVFVAEAAAPLLSAPVPVSVKFLVSLLFWLIGWKSCIGILFSRLGVRIFEPATIGPTRRATKRISNAK